MTAANMEMAAQVHDLALALYRFYTYGEASALIDHSTATRVQCPEPTTDHMTGKRVNES